jgi:hypothetical protein
VKRTPSCLLLIHTVLPSELAGRPPDPATRAPDSHPIGRPSAASAVEWVEGGCQCHLTRPRPPKRVAEPPRTARTASSIYGTLCHRLIAPRHLLAPLTLRAVELPHTPNSL